MAEVMPGWISNLEDEELSFIKKFILASGSLKEMAQLYNVTYPTVRLRLDKIIEKIKSIGHDNFKWWVDALEQAVANCDQQQYTHLLRLVQKQ